MTSEERFEAWWDTLLVTTTQENKPVLRMAWQEQDRYYEARIKELEAELATAKMFDPISLQLSESDWWDTALKLRDERIHGELQAELAALKEKPPFDNCKFEHCDLPGQCKSEGKCHHPTTELAALKGKQKPVAWARKDTLQTWEGFNTAWMFPSPVGLLNPVALYLSPPNEKQIKAEALRESADKWDLAHEYGRYGVGEWLRSMAEELEK